MTKKDKEKRLQKDQAKILACINLIVETVEDSDVKPDSQFEEFYNKAKELSDLGMPILDRVYKQKELSSSTFINDMTEKVEYQFKKLYRL